MLAVVVQMSPTVRIRDAWQTRQWRSGFQRTPTKPRISAETVAGDSFREPNLGAHSVLACNH